MYLLHDLGKLFKVSEPKLSLLWVNIYRPWTQKESAMTEWLTCTFFHIYIYTLSVFWSLWVWNKTMTVKLAQTKHSRIIIITIIRMNTFPVFRMCQGQEVFMCINSLNPPTGPRRDTMIPLPTLPPFLRWKKVWHKKVKWFAQGHASTNWWNQASNSQYEPSSRGLWIHPQDSFSALLAPFS